MSENYILTILSALIVTMAYERSMCLAITITRNIPTNIHNTFVKIASRTIAIRKIHVGNNLQHYIPKIEPLSYRAGGDIIHDI